MTPAPPRYSILIPTRNGIRYLPHAVDSVLSQKSGDFELVVSDNHSTDGTSDYLATIADPRFRHVKPDRLLPMAAHFEFIITQGRGTWITTLGDDDGLMPFAFETLDRLELEKSGCDAAFFKRAYYFWAGCEELYGRHVMSYEPSPARRSMSNTWAILLCLASVDDYIHFPQLYTNGFVKRTYVEAIKRKAGGRFFHGSSPDASSVAALALHAKRHYRYEESVFWTGTSPKSTGFSGGSDAQKDRAAEFSRLNAENPSVPDVLPAAISKIFDFAVIFYEALLQNPASPRFWSSRPLRNIFLAGLARKNETYRAQIEDIYKGDLKPFELRVSMMLVGIIAAIWKRQNGPDTRDESRSIYSEDRDRFPTMADASACVLRLNTQRSDG